MDAHVYEGLKKTSSSIQSDRRRDYEKGRQSEELFGFPLGSEHDKRHKRPEKKRR
jgi:hypothetical protein